MSIKLFKDTIQLSEFGNQRYLYGNFLPAFFGLFLCCSFILWDFPITSEYLPLLGILTLGTMLFAFIAHRISRVLIFYVCFLEKKYQRYLEEKKVVDASINSFIAKFEENERYKYDFLEQEKDNYKQILLEDFKQCFNENFYNPQASLEGKELRRHETIFLMAFWGIVWLIVSWLFFLAFSQIEGTIDIILFHNIERIGEFHFALFFPISIILCFFLFILELVGIREQILIALPLYIKPENPVIEARHEAVKEILEQSSKNDEKKLIINQMIDEYHSTIQSELREKTAINRLKKALIDKKFLSESQTENFIEAIQETKDLGGFINPSELDVLFKIKRINKLPAYPLMRVTENGNIFFMSLNNIKELPPEIDQLKELETLMIKKCEFKSFPPEIGNLTKLSYLFVDKTPITTLPPEIGNLTKLDHLWIANTLITTLPPEIGKLKKLTRLWISSNKITHLPSEIGELTKLEELRISKNLLKELPLEVTNLKKLKIFTYHNNELDRFIKKNKKVAAFILKIKSLP